MESEGVSQNKFMVEPLKMKTNHKKKKRVVKRRQGILPKVNKERATLNRIKIQEQKKVQEKEKEEMKKKEQEAREANMVIVGVGRQRESYECECNLPQYNLGDYFSNEQEKLIPVQKQRNHRFENVIIDQRKLTEEVKKCSEFTQKCFVLFCWLISWHLKV